MSEKLTRSMQIQLRKEKVMIQALSLFCSNGLEETSIEQIAKAAEIGPASVYRYFETKAELAIECGIFYWKQTADKYVNVFQTKEYLEKTGFGQMQIIMKLLQEIFLKEQSFLVFLQEFDIFVKKYNISAERLKNYEQQILNLKGFVTEALKKGLEDHSIVFKENIDDMYFSLMHTMISLMQKLSVHGELLNSDQNTDNLKQLCIVSDLLLKGLEKQS